MDDFLQLNGEAVGAKSTREKHLLTRGHLLFTPIVQVKKHCVIIDHDQKLKEAH